MNEDLRKWFSQKWVRMDTKGNIKGDCAREPGEGKPKCLPLAKASAMDKEDRAAAARRKRREDPVADRPGKGGKPVNVATEEVSTSELIKKSHNKRGAPGTLKAKIQGPLTLAKVRSLKNRPGATTLDKKQANFYINMHSEEYLEEKNVPTNPSLWARAKSLARSKFDVYPSAYANGWAAKWYKGKGGGWKSVQEGKQMKSLKDIISEGVAVSSDFKLVNSVNAQGKPITRKVRAHRKTISPEKMNSEQTPDVLASIQKFVGRQYAEEVDQVEEGLKTIYHKIMAKRAGSKADDAADMDDEKEFRKQVDKSEYHRVKAGGKPTRINKNPDSKMLTTREEVEHVDYILEYESDLAKMKKSDSYKVGDKVWTKVGGQWHRGHITTPLNKAGNHGVKFHHKGMTHSTVSNPHSELRLNVEEVEQVDEIDMSKTLAAFNKGKPEHAQAKIDTRTAAERKAETVKKLAAQKKPFNPVKMAPATKADMDKQIAKSYSQHKPGQYVGDSVELYGEPIVEVKKSAAVRWQEALQKVKKQREEEETRKKENEKRALNPKQTNEAKDPREYDYEGDMAKTQLRSIIANSQSVHDMLKDTTNLAEWVQSKITKAEDYISTVADYMTAEMNEQTSDPFADDPEADAKRETEIRALHKKKLEAGQGQKIRDMNPIDRDQYLKDTGRSWNDKTKSIEKIKEAKEDDDEDYTKHHKLDPDSGVEADQHIHVQLKKAIDSTMKPYEVTFKNGKKHSVSSPVAKTIVSAIEKLKPEHRKAVHDELHKSYDSLMGVHKMIVGK